MLFSSETSTLTEVAAENTILPEEIAAMDGVLDDEEAHNVDRPARKSLKKKTMKGKPLAELNVGDTMTGKVKTITTYGAFLDVGAACDGLLHISQLAADFVSDVNEVLKIGQEVDVRIINIDQDKGQVALSMLTEAQEQKAKDAVSAPRGSSNRGGGGGSGGGAAAGRRDDSAILSKLSSKGWDQELFVEGTVVSTVDFGAFVRVDASLLNSECEGELDGLVHISSLATGRVNSVTSVVNTNDKVQVRVKSIEKGKVSLSMLSAADEAGKQDARGGGSGSEPEFEGNKQWKEALATFQTDKPRFKNKPVVVNKRS
jgi:predicted RNA-binding protein with RPS1 domain